MWYVIMWPWLVIDVWQFVTVMCNIMLNSNLKYKRKIKRLSSLYLILTLLSLQGFFSRKTNFYFLQFLSNFLKYSASNYLSFYLYNIFVIYFLSNSPLSKFLSSAKSNFSYLLTSVFNLSSNSVTTSFAFSKSFSIS